MSEIVANLLQGCFAGSLLFGSFVEVRTLLSLVSIKGQEEFVKTFLQVWWPNGRDLMAPLTILTSAAHFYNYYQTKKRTWLYNGLASTSILLWTVLVMGRDINAMRSEETNTESLKDCVRSFCFKHHFRTLVAVPTFSASLYLLADAK